MSSQPLERKVRQLAHDVEGVYDLFDKIDIVVRRHDSRLREIQSHLSDLDVAVGARFDAQDQRFEAIDQRFEAIDQRFEAIDQRFEAIDVRLDGIGGQLTDVLELLRAR